MAQRAHLLDVDDSRDLANRTDAKHLLRDRLQKRVDAGLTLAFISQSLHHRYDFMRMPFEPGGTATWHWSTWYELGTGARCLVKLEISGVTDLKHPMWELGKVKPLYQGVGALGILKTLREAKRVTQRDMARMMGVSRSNIWAIEGADNPRVSTLQRYARVLDERVRIRVIPYMEGGNR